ncbi:Spy/CpxP family protein refolding chaperone [Rhodocytophaga aerolata]|uniref:Spy/CpxP family protein refolding chaperone n=1 Tax=Rhodocytophaga aerolata TaxID=455078 RepID=A0ABT8R7N0_9BACT|nr:Spy/CpxP family protein refolding chaperone [Rhodocytophaga aerolata]MDO1448109.1 Spy/CpxP family protein refolding chaperone [Rhodocytophaga aerolata]
MKNIFFLMVFVCISLTSLAQRPSSGARERISTAKIGLITDRLNLSTEQAPQFWAVYNEYTDKKRDIRRQIRGMRNETSTITSTDEQVQKSLQDMIALRQKEVDLEKEYMNKFLKTISARQLAELYKTEQDFTKLLLERLEDGHTRHRPND